MPKCRMWNLVLQIVEKDAHLPFLVFLIDSGWSILDLLSVWNSHMATYHLSIKSGGRGKAVQHSDYISKHGKYGQRPEAAHLLAHEQGNLPSWAGSSRQFWAAADRYERVNGATYRELEAALPAELTLEQQKALVRDFVGQVVGDKPFQWVIHQPIAALGGVPQPHAHVMFSDRVPDGIERSAETHFRRFNPKCPELGGCRKDSGGKGRLQLREAVVETRRLWAELTNEHLARHGHDARVDHRSNTDRGIKRQAGRHLGPARVRQVLAVFSPQPQYSEPL